MIGIDTNVLIRYLMLDDETQSAIASEFIESLSVENPGFISLVAVVETTWVLSRSYNLRREEVVQVLEALLRSRELIVDDSADVLRALRKFQAGKAVFADCLIEQLGKRSGCIKTVTFDSAAVKSTGMSMLSA